jgi:hypothetical protein
MKDFDSNFKKLYVVFLVLVVFDHSFEITH